MKLEKDDLKSDPDYEKHETLYLLKTKGFSDEDAAQLTEIIIKNPLYWLEFNMMYELDLPINGGENPILTSLATFVAFIGFGSIPLIPYLLLSSVENTFLLSILFTFFALASLGTLRWKLTGERLIKSIMEVVFIGGVSAVVAYLVGTIFAG